MQNKSNSISRRMLLRGAGVAMALPALEVFGATPDTAPKRLVAIQTNQGIMPHLFFPESTGRDYELSPYLKTLEPIRDQFTVFSGLSHPGVDGGHSNEVSFLTGAPHPAGAAFSNSISLDQVAAEAIGSETRFPFLAVSCSNAGGHGMSFNRAGVAIPTESSATSLYRQLFVQGTEAEVAARVNDLRSGRSLLDTVGDRARRLEKSVGTIDRDRLAQYFTALRELEQQFQKAEVWAHQPKPKVELPEPQDIKESAQLVTRLKNTFDVLRLALETDSTRVISLFVQPLGVLSGVPGVSNETHSLTHHGNREEMINELRIIEEAQFREFADFLTGLRDSGLLNMTSVIYGTCMGNANGHTNTNWPMLLAGGGFRHGRHLAFDRNKNEPLANLFVSILQQMGLEVDAFSSSTGSLRGLETA